MAIEPVTREERFLAAASGRSVTPPTPITRKEQLLQGIIDAVKSGGATPDVIENAVNNYLDANPVKPGATTEQAAQIEQNKTDIADLQAEIDDKQPKGDYVKTVNGNKPDASGNVVVAIGGNGSGENAVLTSAQINALDGMFKVCAFTKADVSAEYNAFCTAFGIEGGGIPDTPDEPEVPEVTLYSITASYNGGDVPVGTAVADLTGIVVTAHYSDGSSETVTGYTLSGTIAEGENTVTVTYQGKTATFTVNGIAESTGENNGWTDGEAYTIEWTDGYGIDHNGSQGGGSIGAEFVNTNRAVSGFLPCRGASAVNVSGIYTNYGVFFYDSEKNYIANQRVVDYSAPVPVPLEAYYVRVQCITTNKANASVTPIVLELMTESTVWESGKRYRLDWESGKQINTNAGGEVVDHPTNAKRDVSGFALCMGATTITIAFKLKVMVVFYDGDKSYISMGLTGTNANTVMVPEGAVYVRIDTSGYGDGLNTWIMMQ